MLNSPNPGWHLAICILERPLEDPGPHWPIACCVGMKGDWQDVNFIPNRCLGDSGGNYSGNYGLKVSETVIHLGKRILVPWAQGGRWALCPVGNKAILGHVKTKTIESRVVPIVRWWQGCPKLYLVPKKHVTPRVLWDLFFSYYLAKSQLNQALTYRLLKQKPIH